MSEPAEFPELEDLWLEPDSGALFCCSCNSYFGSAPLIRTFRLSHESLDNHASQYTKIISTPFDQSIILYDRHFRCLLQSGIRYSAISHVWDPTISSTQYLGRFAPPSLEDCYLARRLAIQQPYFAYRGLLRSGEISEHDEIWHDYISVPQWTDKIKDQILPIIPDIFGSAYITNIHLEDLSKSSIDMLYHSQSTDASLKAITDVCNAKWFTRVWTAMEYISSRHLIAMNETFDVYSDRTDPICLDRVHDIWNKERSKHESVYNLEAKAEIGKNIVPWNLGLLRSMTKGKSSAFGHAFALLSRRRCQSNQDFIHALLGCVVPTSDRPLERDFDREYLRIAKLCLVVGDYSPLLMTPRLGKDGNELRGNQGFNDIEVWPLGAGRQLPEFHQDFSFENGDFDKGDPILKMQRIACIVLKATGPDLGSFVETLGWRLYDEDAKFIKKKLKQEGNWEKLARALQTRHCQKTEDGWPIAGPDGAQWFAEAMGISDNNPKDHPLSTMSRIAYLDSHGGTLHVGHAELNCTPSVFCASCCRTLVFLAGLFEPLCDSANYIAYRIPGLKYRFTHPNGIGLILQNDRIVGRMVWATPACACSTAEIVKIKMPVLPAPSPRPYT